MPGSALLGRRRSEIEQTGGCDIEHGRGARQIGGRGLMGKGPRTITPCDNARELKTQSDVTYIHVHMYAY